MEKERHTHVFLNIEPARSENVRCTAEMQAEIRKEKGVIRRERHKVERVGFIIFPTNLLVGTLQGLAREKKEQGGKKRRVGEETMKTSSGRKGRSAREGKKKELHTTKG
jgi:hypothetical protein